MHRMTPAPFDLANPTRIPPLSVVMPVHNAMPYLDAAIRAILEQSFTDFEFIIGDDCSTDGSAERALEFARQDPRIRVLQSSTRLGPAGSSNWVANAGRAPLVARMDADDLCHPRRLEAQMRALADHPTAVLVGTLCSLIDRFDQPLREADRSMLIGRQMPPIAHSSILYRKQAFDQVGGYSRRADYFEDAELYRRLAPLGEILVISDGLLRYRHAGTSSRLKDAPHAVRRSLDAMPTMLRTGTLKEHDSDKLDPAVFLTLASLRVWSNQSPRILMDMFRHMRILPLRASAKVIVSAVLCSLSPALTRHIVRARLAWRNWRVRRRIPPGHLFRWVPNAEAINLGRVDLPVTE
jgi:hypothetical protein